MNKKTLFFIFSFVFLGAALAAMLFLPARIGTHSDGMDVQRSTEERFLSLAMYYEFARAESDIRNTQIGTTPYSNYYVRTYALELWVIGGLLLLIGLRAAGRVGRVTT